MSTRPTLLVGMNAADVHPDDLRDIREWLQGEIGEGYRVVVLNGMTSATAIPSLSWARDDRDDLASAIEEQLRINASLGVPESLQQSEFLRGQAHAWVHVLGLLDKGEKEA